MRNSLAKNKHSFINMLAGNDKCMEWNEGQIKDFEKGK